MPAPRGDFSQQGRSLKHISSGMIALNFNSLLLSGVHLGCWFMPSWTSCAKDYMDIACWDLLSVMSGSVAVTIKTGFPPPFSFVYSFYALYFFSPYIHQLDTPCRLLLGSSFFFSYCVTLLMWKLSHTLQLFKRKGKIPSWYVKRFKQIISSFFFVVLAFHRVALPQGNGICDAMQLRLWSVTVRLVLFEIRFLSFFGYFWDQISWWH